MDRISHSLATLLVTAGFLSTPAVSAETLESLGSRISSIEVRLGQIEKALGSQAAPSTPAPVNPTQTGPVAGGEKTYVIKTGDTLGAIARNHGVSREDLLAANRLSEGQPIYIGETLVIPTVSAPPVADTPPVPQTGPVAPQDQQRVSVPTPPAPQTQAPDPGKPEAPQSSSVVHVVAKGDTLTSLARRYNTTVPAIKQLNKLGSDIIGMGERLRIPVNSGGSPQPPVARNDGASDTNEGGYAYDNPRLRPDETYGYYKVRKGDNLYALARDFFTNMAELQRLNEMADSTLIFPGDELIVPTGKYNAYHSNEQMAAR